MRFLHRVSASSCAPGYSRSQESRKNLGALAAPRSTTRHTDHSAASAQSGAASASPDSARARGLPLRGESWPCREVRSPEAPRLARATRRWVAGPGRDLSTRPVTDTVLLLPTFGRLARRRMRTRHAGVSRMPLAYRRSRDTSAATNATVVPAPSQTMTLATCKKTRTLYWFIPPGPDGVSFLVSEWGGRERLTWSVAPARGPGVLRARPSKATLAPVR
jgi:hypothetical protein